MIRVRHVGAAAALLVAWWAAGCGSRLPHGPGGSGGFPGCPRGTCSDAASDASPAPDAAVDTATSTVDSAVDAGGMQADATVSDASAGPADASEGGASDGNAADAGTSDANPFDASNLPWPYGPGVCFAPCELEAIKDCLPAKFPSCVHIDQSPEPYTGYDTYCAATFSTTFSYSFHAFTMTVSNNGKVCYSRTAEFSSNGPFFASVYDGSGKLIATESQGMPGTARTVYCGGGPDAGPVYEGLQPTGCDYPQTLNCESVVEGTSCPSDE